MNKIIQIVFLLLFLNKSFAQELIGTIPLNTSLEKVYEIIQFSDDQGNILFKFDGKDYSQYSLMQQNKIIESKNLEINDRYEFLECIYNENNFTLFYRDKKNDAIKMYKIGSESLNTLAETNIQISDEKYLASSYYKGDFLVFKYSKSPFTLHTYRYKEGQYFEKKSQTFNNKKENFFLGQIRTENEIAFVRLTMNKPFAFHFYRYNNEKGFEKKSIDIRSVYKKAGYKTKVFLSELEFTSSTELSASIQGNNIYLNMDNLVHINPSFSKKINSRQFPGVLEFNWENENSKIVSFDKKNTTDFSNRAVALLDNFYFKLLVNNDYLDLSIFEISSHKLLKKFTYNVDQEIDIIYGSAKLNKTKNLNLNLSSVVFLPIQVSRPKDEDIGTKKLLKNLSRGELFLDVFSDGRIIEFSASSISEKVIVFDVISEANFICYFLKSDLSVVKNLDNLEDTRYTKVEEYIKKLEQTNENVENIIVYSYQRNIYVAYIDKKGCNSVFR